jgi:hypothetical protein
MRKVRLGWSKGDGKKDGLQDKIPMENARVEGGHCLLLLMSGTAERHASTRQPGYLGPSLKI